MPSVDQAAQIFSILSDLVLADHLSKHVACFPLNNDLQSIIAKARLHYDTFLSCLQEYAGMDDALMERHNMVPWLSRQPIDVAYCEGFFSLALNESVFGSYERGLLPIAANRVLSTLWPRFVQALVVARFTCRGETPRPNYRALADVLTALNTTLGTELDSVANQSGAVLSTWWSKRACLSSGMLSDDQDSFLTWTATETLR